MAAKEPRYRLNVAAILQSPQGHILICERLGRPGLWQFPQGGVDKGETLAEAIARELEEEVGVTADQWVEVRNDGPFRYHHEPGRKSKVYAGKDQHFFLLEFHAAPDSICVDLPAAEFQGYQWIEPQSFSLLWLPKNKRGMYQQAFAALLNIQLA